MAAAYLSGRESRYNGLCTWADVGTNPSLARFQGGLESSGGRFGSGRHCRIGLRGDVRLETIRIPHKTSFCSGSFATLAPERFSPFYVRRLAGMVPGKLSACLGSSFQSSFASNLVSISVLIFDSNCTPLYAILNSILECETISEPIVKSLLEFESILSPFVNPT